MAPPTPHQRLPAAPIRIVIPALTRTLRVASAVVLLAVLPAALFYLPEWEHSTLVAAVVVWYVLTGGMVARGVQGSAVIEVDAATRTLRVARRPWFRLNPAEVVPFADLQRVFVDADRIQQFDDGPSAEPFWVYIPKICLTRRSAATIELSLHLANREAEADAIVRQILEALRVAQCVLGDPCDEAPFRGRRRDLGA